VCLPASPASWGRNTAGVVSPPFSAFLLAPSTPSPAAAAAAAADMVDCGRVFGWQHSGAKMIICRGDADGGRTARARCRFEGRAGVAVPGLVDTHQRAISVRKSCEARWGRESGVAVAAIRAAALRQWGWRQAGDCDGRDADANAAVHPGVLRARCNM
jgi:hypothetical protein